MSNINDNKQAALKAVALLTHLLEDTPYEVLELSVTSSVQTTAYVINLKMAVTAEELLQVVDRRTEEYVPVGKVSPDAQYTAYDKPVEATSPLDESLIDEMVREVSDGASVVFGGEFTATRQDGNIVMTRDDGAVEIEMSEDELRLDDDRVIINAQFDGKPLPEGAILTGKQMKQRIQERMQTSLEEERQYNQEMLDLGELDEQEFAKPATIKDAQKQPKIIRRRQPKSRLDEAATADALNKRKPKPVTAAQNMTPRKVSHDELAALAQQFTGDWKDDLEFDTKTETEEMDEK